ncbi:MAG: endolytic transglycosylase MltG [Muribaculaceae bacterium]|nr:endolytic transglycosylase MltG [Muribaculaceae bacterium]
MTKQKKARKPHRSNRITMWILIAVSAIIIVGLVTIAPFMVNGSSSDVAFRIPKNATMQHVTDTLNKYFPEDYSNKVVKLLKIYGFKPEERHGYYELPAGATPFATMRKLSRGAQTPVRLTINCFRSLPYLSQRMGLKMEFTPEEFMAAAQDSAYLAKYGLTPEQALSLFLEDSYDVYWTATPYEVLDKIGDNYLGFWSEGRREQAENLSLTPAEVMTLASIVDDETNQVIEKGKIGRLYVNRLDKGMKLQADPTVRYALNDLSIRRVTNEHLKVDSPYNTYQHEGLPPGPLRTTSRSTLTEILNSEPSNYLFMCARPDFSGYHNFAATYDEHLENARLYQNALDEKGIK